MIEFELLGSRLDAALSLTFDAQAISYRFDYRRDGVLLWRADSHTGHEVEFGGRHHLHIGPTEHVRVASSAYSLQDIADLIARTNLDLIHESG